MNSSGQAQQSPRSECTDGPVGERKGFTEYDPNELVIQQDAIEECLGKCLYTLASTGNLKTNYSR